MNGREKKIQVKRSYLILTWFYYMTFVDKKKQKTLQLSCLPSRKSTLTNIKAPIAHKNWSKEQFSFHLFFFKVSFDSNVLEQFDISSVNAGLLLALLSKKNFPVFETNLLFLKSYSIFFIVKDRFFFKY